MSDLDELRALVREVIRDVLPKGLPVTETVNLSTDEDLAVFVARLLDADAQTREDLRTGRKRFRLAAPVVPSTPQITLSPAAYGSMPASEVPEILASQIITMLDPQQAFLVNRNKIGSMALAGESLFVLEMQPASYAILAANEAEKAARIKLVDYRMIGATGRLYLSGSEADVRQAAEAAEDILRSLT